MTKLPSIVCRTATFGRGPLLNEAVGSFLRQDYPGPKRMFILNDCPGVEYWCDHPDIHVENSPTRFPTLGDKFNHLLGSFECDIVVNWPDDDIMLPHAISTVVESIQDRDVFAGVGFWYMESGEIKKFDRLHCAGVLAFRHKLWRELGGYASMNSGEDKEFLARIRNHVDVEFSQLSPDQAYFIYRWATGFGHLSGYDHSSTDGYAEYGETVMGRSVPGQYEIRPTWKCDYQEMVKEFLNCRSH
jgi:hypothetical protein